MKLNTIINSENLINIGKFLAKPIIIFLICRIFVQIINKISSNVLRKTHILERSMSLDFKSWFLYEFNI